MKKQGADDIKVFGGGGGTITHDDQRGSCNAAGWIRFSSPALRLSEMVRFVRAHYGQARRRAAANTPEIHLARKLTAIEDSYANGKRGKKKIRNSKAKGSKIRK